MMHMANIKMTTTVPRLKLLETLKANLERHVTIVKEAKAGYIEKARKALEKRLQQLQEGQIVSLQFQFSPPVDYSEVYKNTISMLEWNTNETVELQADEFRQLVRDEWDWQQNFLSSNMSYSKQAFDWLNETVGGSLVPLPE